MPPASSVSAPTVDALRAAQSRIFDGGSADVILKAFRISLIKEGHIVRQFDPKKGILVVGLRKGKAGARWNDWQQFLGSEKSARMEISVQARSRGPKNVETRVSMQRITLDNLGRIRGSEVADEKVYHSLYVLVNSLLGSSDEPEEEATE